MTDQAKLNTTHRVRLLPSLLAADFARIGEEAHLAIEAGAEGLHADIMDGRFVPPITMGADIVAAVIRETGAWVDAHLMILEPERQIEAFAGAGVKAITVHLETCPHLHRVLWQIHETGCEAGVAVNPATSIGNLLEYALPLVDRVLVMSVNPGWGGQTFIHETLLKIHEIRQALDRLGSHAELQVDGGVNRENAAEIVKHGATELVAGTAVFKGDIAQNLSSLRRAADNALSV